MPLFVCHSRPRRTDRDVTSRNPIRGYSFLRLLHTQNSPVMGLPADHPDVQDDHRSTRLIFAGQDAISLRSLPLVQTGANANDIDKNGWNELSCMEASGYERLDVAIDFIDNTATTRFAFSRQPGKRSDDRIFPYLASRTLLVFGRIYSSRTIAAPCLEDRSRSMA